MSESIESELKDIFLSGTNLNKNEKLPPIEPLLDKTLSVKNSQTGSNDVLTLAIASLFAVLLVFLSPFVNKVASRNSLSSFSIKPNQFDSNTKSES